MRQSGVFQVSLGLKDIIAVMASMCDCPSPPPCTNNTTPPPQHASLELWAHMCCLFSPDCIVAAWCGLLMQMCRVFDGLIEPEPRHEHNSMNCVVVIRAAFSYPPFNFTLTGCCVSFTITSPWRDYSLFHCLSHTALLNLSASMSEEKVLCTSSETFYTVARI